MPILSGIRFGLMEGITGAYKHICHFNSKGIKKEQKTNLKLLLRNIFVGALIQVMTTKFLPTKTCMLHFMTSSRSEKRYGF